MINKIDIRKFILNKRNLINKKNKIKKDFLILIKLINFIIKNKIKSIGIYFSIKNEVNTINFIHFFLLFNKKIIISLPKITKNKKLINFYIINNFYQDIKFNKKIKLFEPINKLKKIKKNKIHCLIIPIVAFDKNLNRLGYGKGYYDKYLKKFKGIKLGIAYSFQKVKKIPMENHDIALDKIITD